MALPLAPPHVAGYSTFRRAHIATYDCSSLYDLKMVGYQHTRVCLHIVLEASGAPGMPTYSTDENARISIMSLLHDTNNKH